jgi:hypothetical protein
MTGVITVTACFVVGILPLIAIALWLDWRA